MDNQVMEHVLTYYLRDERCTTPH